MLPWAKFVFPEAAFCNKIGGCFHLRETLREAYSSLPRHLPGQCCFPTSATIPMTWSSSGSSTSPTTLPTTASCALHWWPPPASLPWSLGEQGGKEGASYLHLQQSTSPSPACEKGFFLHWRDLLVQPSGWHILLSTEAKVCARCSGKAQFGWAPQQGLPMAWPVLLPQRLPGPPEALPPPAPWCLWALNSLWVDVQHMSPLRTQPALLWAFELFPFSQGTKS